MGEEDIRVGPLVDAISAKNCTQNKACALCWMGGDDYRFYVARPVGSDAWQMWDRARAQDAAERFNGALNECQSAHGLMTPRYPEAPETALVAGR